MNKPLNKEELRAEALSRARNGTSFANYPAIVEGFRAKGIPEHDIEPRVNVFTYNAWLAKGRQVRKGEKGVKIFTWIVVGDQDDENGRKVMKATTVFHVSQTDDRDANPRGQVSYRDGIDPKTGHGKTCNCYDCVPPKKPVRDYVRDPGEDAADAWSNSHSADR